MREERRALTAGLSQTEATKLYDWLSGVYDVWGRLTVKKARRRYLEMTGIRDGQHILEVAVETSLALAEIVRKNPKGRNLGIDIFQRMLAKAQRRPRAEARWVGTGHEF